MVEEARLESVYTGNRIKGSNPLVSADFFSSFAVQELFSQYLLWLKNAHSNQDHILQTMKAKCFLIYASARVAKQPEELH